MLIKWELNHSEHTHVDAWILYSYVYAFSGSNQQMNGLFSKSAALLPLHC